MAQLITVDGLINDVRSMLDENNLASVDDERDILPALNRAQRYATNILTRHYEPPMLTHVTVQTVNGQEEYDMPEDAMEERLEKVEVNINALFYPLTQISYRDISFYETTTAVSSPYYYCVVGRRIRLVPKSSGAYPLRMWYLQEPANLVKTQGRIQKVNTSGKYVVVDAIGADLTTEIDNLDSYINIIDAESGKRKATFQVKNLTGNKIEFKSVPSRSMVQNISIDTDPASLLVNTTNPLLGPTVSIEPDDYVCLISGSCVPFFKNPFSNFLVQYAVAEIRRKLGGPAELEQTILKELETQVERSWVGREQTLRVHKASNRWNALGRRRFSSRTS